MSFLMLHENPTIVESRNTQNVNNVMCKMVENVQNKNIIPCLKIYKTHAHTNTFISIYSKVSLLKSSH